MNSRRSIWFESNSRFEFQISLPRIDEIPAEVFLLPKRAACKTAHTPTIPAMTTNFHAKIEVCDRTGYENIGKT